MKHLPFQLTDLLRVKWSLTFFLICLGVSIYFSVRVDTLDYETGLTLTQSQRRLNQARESVEKIEEEEATIIEYIDRYRIIEGSGALDEEDRLQFKETFARIRDRHNLFPIQLTVGEQYSIPLEYPDDGSDGGGPINLQSSAVSFTLPLLHEGDLTRLLADLRSSQGIYQIRGCTVNSNYFNRTSYFQLAQNFTAQCEMRWYTFDLDPEGEQR